MRALSIWNPWAMACVLGTKRIETRGWATKHRGTLLIHAGARRLTNGDLARYNASWVWHYALEAVGGTMAKGPGGGIAALPYAAIIGAVDVVDCVRVEELTLAQVDRRFHDDTNYPEAYTERALGDYSPHRWGWLLANPRRFAEPIPYRGAQGLFQVPDELVAKALA